MKPGDKGYPEEIMDLVGSFARDTLGINLELNKPGCVEDVAMQLRYLSHEIAIAKNGLAVNNEASPAKIERTIVSGQAINSGKKDTLKDITSAIPGIVFQYKIDKKGKTAFIFVSEGSTGIWGLTPEQVYHDGSLPFSKIHEEDIDELNAAMAASNLAESEFYHTFRIVTDDGRIKWLQANGKAQKNEDGDIIRTGFILEITKLKEAEKMLAQSEAFAVSLMSSTTSQLAVINEQGSLIATNKAWEDFGSQYPGSVLPRAITGTNYLKLCENAGLTGDTIAWKAYKGIRSVFKKEVPRMEMQYCFDSPEGEKWFLFRIMTVISDTPKILLAHNDISKIKQTERLARENYDKYKTILDTTDEMINTVSIDGKIMWANNAWKRNLLYTDEQLAGLTITDVFSKETKVGFESRIEKLRKGEKVEIHSATLIAANNSLVHVRGSIVPLLEGGQIKGTQGFFRNISEIAKAQADRLKAEVRLQKTLDNMFTACTILGFNWEFLYINDAAAAHGFMAPSNFAGKTMPEMFPGVENTNVFTYLKRAMYERVRCEFEEKYLFENGMLKWFEFKVEPVEEGLLVMSIDITEKKAAEENIRKHQELLRESQRIARLGSWELDINKNILLWSDETYLIFEIDRGVLEPHYDAFLALVHPEDREYVLRSYKESISRHEPYNIIHRLRFPDGRIKYIHEQGETMYDRDGNPVRSVGTVHDITRQREAEILLQNNEYKYQQVVENIGDGLMMDDVSGRIFFSNKQFLDMFGLVEGDLGHIYLGDIVAPSYKSFVVYRHNRRVAGKDELDFFEFEGIRKDGAKRWFEARVSLVKQNDKIEGTQSIIRDITERKEAERMLEYQNTELKKINSELDRFVYSTSHDLRAPLLSLLGLVNLCKTTTDSLELNQYYRMMTESIDRLDNTIKEILVYSRNSRMQLHIEALDLSAIIHNCVDSIMHIQGAEKIRFNIATVGETPFLSDRIRVSTIVNNLVNNAVKYQRRDEPHPYINISFSSDEEAGILIVEDNGEGIPEEKQQKVFEMFYRNSEKSEGSGLGLYICREILNKIGGYIEVKSEPGKGCTFTVHMTNHAQA